MRKSLLLFLVLFSLAANAQTPPPPACVVLTVTDSDNDGFAQFDLDAYLVQFRINALTVGTGFDLSGYQIKFYPSETDYHNVTNLITSSPYTNTIAHEQFCFMDLVYTGSGPTYDQADLLYFFSCHVLETTSSLATSNQTKDLLQVYPNPVSGFLNVKLNMKSAFSINIYDLNGRKLITETSSLIDVSKLQNGIYLVNVASEGKQYNQKITVSN